MTEPRPRAPVDPWRTPAPAPPAPDAGEPAPELVRLVRRYTGFQLTFSLLFWLPVFYEYQRQAGLSDPEIFGIQAYYYVAFCLLEVPTGMAADQLGYRRCMGAGALTLVVANALPIFLPSYAGFLTHFMLIALARSFVSGASSAYLYNSLQASGEEADYKQVEGRARAYGLVAKVVGWAGVGALMQWRHTSPYWLSVASALGAVGFALVLPEVEASPARPEDARPGGRLRRTAGIMLGSPLLLLAVLQGVAIFVLARVCQAGLFQPILGSKGMPLESYGLVMAMMTAFEAVGSGRSRWVSRVLDDSVAVLVFTSLLALAMLGIPASGPWGTVALLAVLAYCAGVVFPLQRQVVNDAIPDSHYRATILSVESIVDRGANAWVAATIGGFLAAGQLDPFLRRAAGVTVVAMLALYGLRRLWTRRGGGAAPSCEGGGSAPSPRA